MLKITHACNVYCRKYDNIFYKFKLVTVLCSIVLQSLNRIICNRSYLEHCAHYGHYDCLFYPASWDGTSK